MFTLLFVTNVLIFYSGTVVAGGNIAGYHYEKPSTSLGLVGAPLNLGHSHNFSPLPTIQPLPPVPALPPLPTPRSKGQFIQTETIYQTHPVGSLKPLPSSYLPAAGSSIGKIAQQYQPSSLPSPLLAPSTSVVPAPPLRVPFGKQAIVSFPSGPASGVSYDPHARELKQYAVIEIIDNDIEQDTQPFMNSPFFDSYRAHLGVTRTFANSEPLSAIQIDSRSHAALLGQQRLASQKSANDAVALGSGGLGFIRLANGNIYLGSGSLGYVSGQQYTQDINEARTRMGAPQPDALHFGHGPLDSSNRFNKFSYRFK